MKFKRIIIGLLLITILAGGITMAIPIFKNRELDKSNLISCSYSIGGGMMGGFSSLTIRKNQDGSVNYISKNAKTHADRIVTKTYSASDEDLQTIKKLVIDYNMYSVSKKGLNPIQALDGDTASMSFMFDNGQSFRVSDNQDLSRAEMDKFNDIVKVLSGLAKGEAVVEIENHVLVLILDGYQIAYTLIESNATEQLIENLDKCKFYRYEDSAQVAVLNKEIDTADLNKTKQLIKGGLYYDANNKELIFAYDGCEYKEEVYQIGEIEDDYESSFELIKKMENREYIIAKRK